MTRKTNATVLYDGNTSHSEGTSWADSAKCIGVDTNLFFEDERDDFTSRYAWVQSNRTKLKEARALCKGCPVIEECLNANLDTRDGVFGGKSYKQREAMAKKDGTWVAIVPQKTRQHMEPERVALILKHRDLGLSYGDIEQLTGINRGTISRVLNNPVYNTNAKPLSESSATSVRFQKNWDEPKYKAVRELIYDGRMTAKQVGEITGFSAKTVRRVKYSMDRETKV